MKNLFHSRGLCFSLVAAIALLMPASCCCAAAVEEDDSPASPAGACGSQAQECSLAEEAQAPANWGAGECESEEECGCVEIRAAVSPDEPTKLLSSVGEGLPMAWGTAAALPSTMLPHTFFEGGWSIDGGLDMAQRACARSLLALGCLLRF